MRSGSRYLIVSFSLAAALAAPAAMRSASLPQDDHRDDKRVYDKSHKDYHNWDDNEDRAYRQYLTEKHREYRPFTELNEKDQNAYWGWRHSHPDRH